MSSFLSLLLSAIASGLATMLIKLSHKADSSSAGLLSLSSRHLYLGSALAAYGLGFACYVFALRSLPISVGYPVMTGLTLLFIACIGRFLFGEEIALTRIVGMALILVGIFLTAS